MNARAVMLNSLFIAPFVVVLTVIIGFTEGLQRHITAPVDVSNYVVLSPEANEELRSFITSKEVNVVIDRPEIDIDSSGATLVSPEIVTGFDPRAVYASSQYAETYIRGVEPIAYRVHSEMQLLKGQWPQPGTNELVVGRRLAHLFPYLAPSNQIRFGTRVWKIVGVFSDGGSSRESEVWADFRVLQAELQYSAYVNAIFVKLRSGQGTSFQQALAGNSRLFLEAKPETTFRQHQSGLATFMTVSCVSLLIALSLGVAFVLGKILMNFARSGDPIVEARRGAASGRYRDVCKFGLTIGAVGGLEGVLLTNVLIHSSGIGLKLIDVGRFIFSFRATPQAMAAGVLFGTLVGAVASLVAMVALRSFAPTAASDERVRPFSTSRAAAVIVRCAASAGAIAVSTLVALLSGAIPRAMDTKYAELAVAPRLFVVNRTRPRRALPAAYCGRIQKIPGVTACAAVTGWNVRYAGERYLDALAADDDLFAVFAESGVSSHEVARCRSDPACAVVGSFLAQRYGWRVGQRVTLQQNGAGLAHGPPGLWTLDFVVEAIAKSSPYPNQFVLRRDYLERAIKERGWNDYDLADFITVRVDHMAALGPVANQIDELFRGSPYETRTQTEKVALKSALSALGNLRALARVAEWLALLNVILIAANSTAMAIAAGGRSDMKDPAKSQGSFPSQLVREWLLTVLTGSVVGMSLWLVATTRVGMLALISSMFGRVLDYGDVLRATLVVLLAGLVGTLIGARIRWLDRWRLAAESGEARTL
jgi:putative ABC transport system permease protein